MKKICRIALIGLPGIFKPTESARWINLVLLIATIASTLLVGALYGADSLDQVWQIWRGWPFALSIMLILGTHEMGHYIAARYHNVPVTLPYFIPMPLGHRYIGSIHSPPGTGQEPSGLAGRWGGRTAGCLVGLARVSLRTCNLYNRAYLSRCVS
ncbi:MAG: hypothetical protein R3C44_21050 [Chloroflexota bacterium]